MKIVFALQDAGGCDFLVPVINDIKMKKTNRLLCLASKNSKNILKKEKIDYIDVDQSNLRKLYNSILDFKPDIILTGTSFGFSFDKKIIDFAKIKKIPVISVVDYWSNYLQRFKDMNSNRWYLPDLILVIDKLMMQDMAKEGFNKRKIVVTGNPKFDSFTKKISNNKKSNQILFISQPFSELKKQNLGIGYDEIQSLKDLAEVLLRINKENKKKFYLLIKPHPKENTNKFVNIIKRFKGLRWSIDNKTNLNELLLKSNIILGMSSMVLFQAAIGGKNVVSYQPNVKKDLSILNKIGICKTISRKKYLYHALSRLLFSSENIKIDKKIAKKYISSNSTKKVVDIIENVVKNEIL